MKKILTLLTIVLTAETSMVVAACGTATVDNTNDWDENPIFKSPLNDADVIFIDPLGKLVSTPSTGDLESNLNKARANIKSAFTNENPEVEDREYSTQLESVIHENLDVTNEPNGDGKTLYRDILFTANEVNYTGNAYVNFAFSKGGEIVQDKRPKIKGHNSSGEMLVFQLAGKTMTKEEASKIDKSINDEFDRLNEKLEGIGTAWSTKWNSPEISSRIDSAEIKEGALSGTYTRNYTVKDGHPNVKGTANINIKVLEDSKKDLLGFNEVEYLMSGSVLSSSETKDVNKLIIDKLIEANKKTGRVLDPKTDIEPIEIKNWQGEFQNPGKYDILFTSKAKSNFVGTATGKIILKPDTRTPITTPNPKFIKLQQPEMTDSNAKDFIKTIIDDFSNKNKNIKPSEYEVGGKFNDGEEVMGMENIFKKGSKPGPYVLTFYTKADSKEFKGIASQKYLVEGDFREIVKDFSLKFQMLGPNLNEENSNTHEKTTTEDIQKYVNDQLNQKYPKLDADISNNQRVIYDWSAIEGKDKDDKVQGIVEIPYKIKFEEGVDNGSVEPKIPYKGNAKIKIDLVPVAKKGYGENKIKRDLKLESFFFSGLDHKEEPWDAPKGTTLKKLWDFLLSETLKIIPGFTQNGAYTWRPWEFESIKEWPFQNNDEKDYKYKFTFKIAPEHQIIDEKTSIEIEVTLKKPLISIDFTDSVQRKYNDMYFNPYKVMFNADWDMLVNRPPGLDGSDNGKINPIVYANSPYAEKEKQPGSGYKDNPRDYPKTNNWFDEQIGKNNWKLPSGYSFNDFINIEQDNENYKKIVTMKPFERVIAGPNADNRGSFKNGEVEEKAVNYFVGYYITLLVFRFKSYIEDIAGFVPNFGGVYSSIKDKPILGGGYNKFDFALHIPSKLTEFRGEFNFLLDSWLTNEYLIGQNTKEDIANDWSWKIDGEGIIPNDNYPDGMFSHEPANKFLREKHPIFGNWLKWDDPNTFNNYRSNKYRFQDAQCWGRDVNFWYRNPSILIPNTPISTNSIDDYIYLALSPDKFDVTNTSKLLSGIRPTGNNIFVQSFKFQDNSMAYSDKNPCYFSGGSNQ